MEMSSRLDKLEFLSTEGLCHIEGYPVKFFYPDKNDGVQRAIKVCRQCDVVGQCLDYAIDYSEVHGVWGGESEGERRRITR